MPIKLNIGLSRKVGEANYGSRGASVNLEVELDSGIIRDPQRFQDQIEDLYAMARQSVHDELSLPDEASNDEEPSQQSDYRRQGGLTSRNSGSQRKTGGTETNGHSSSGHSGNGRGGQQRQQGGSATQSQVRAIFAIARQQRLNPKQLVLERYGLERLEDLSIRDASSLIDDLKRGVIGVAS